MTKDLDSGQLDDLSQHSTSMATCIRIARTDGVIQAFTEHPKSLRFNPDSLGQITHHPGYSRSAISNREGTGVDNLNLDGIIDSTNITETDLRAGRYDHAEVWIYWVNWKTVENDNKIVKLKRGRIGKLTLSDDTFSAEFRSLTERLKQEIIEIITADCRYQLGETRCGINLDGDTWTPGMSATVRANRDALGGTVVKPSNFNGRFFEATTVDGVAGGSEPSWNTTLGATTSDGGITWTAIQGYRQQFNVVSVSADRRVFTITGSPFFDGTEDFFFEGLCHFVDRGSPTPLNFGSKPGLVKDFTFLSPSTEALLTLFLEMPFDINVGDELDLVAGCNKLRPTCIEKFNNIYNFGGFPDLPGNDELFKTPNSTS